MKLQGFLHTIFSFLTFSIYCSHLLSFFPLILLSFISISFLVYFSLSLWLTCNNGLFSLFVSFTATCSHTKKVLETSIFITHAIVAWRLCGKSTFDCVHDISILESWNNSAYGQQLSIKSIFSIQNVI